MRLAKTNAKSCLLLSASAAALSLLAGPALAQNAIGTEAETVVVTGTRVQGMTAADSAAPITVLGSEALTQGSGTIDLRQSLGQTVPSFTAESSASDTARLNLNAALRGLSPNDTLVMVNGKRRHGTANLNVSSVNSFAGGAAPDISMIPTGAVDHVEVLLDGAAAQYGTDAIAGVVNFILKKNSSGGDITAQIGRNYAEDADGSHIGDEYDISFNMGMPLFDKGFINFTLDKKYNGAAHTGGADGRLILPDGSIVSEGTIATAPNANGVVTCSGGVCVPLATREALPGYPRINYIGAVTAQHLSAMVSAGYDVSDDVHIYSFGSYGHRDAQAPQNERLPNQTIATLGSDQPYNATTNPQGYKGGLTAAGTPISSGQTGTLYTPGELVPFPLGYTPVEAISENDYQYNLGVQFKLAGWDVDVGGSYGKDADQVYTLNSANSSLFVDTHTTPTNFYDGSFAASEFLGNIDATHQYNVGMASPLTVAIGAEAREDYYAIKAGDPASRYKEGPQAYPGFQPSDASAHSRKNYATYIDFAMAPIEALQLDIAGRYEHYTDFGDAEIGKITARYDFSPKLGVRGTISTGFRAPTLEEEFYSATKVTPTSAVVQLPADSAASQLLGVPNLKPEVSTQYSIGFVTHPLEDLSATIDAYSIAMGDRIVHSSEIFSLGGAINSPLVNQAILLHGNVLDPTATQNGVYMFQNGLSSLTQGVDLTVNYPTDLRDYGLINWTLAANYNQTSVSGVTPVPAQLIAGSPPGVSFFPDYVLYNFVHGSPPDKVGLTANWSLDEWGVTPRCEERISARNTRSWLPMAAFPIIFSPSRVWACSTPKSATI